MANYMKKIDLGMFFVTNYIFRSAILAILLVFVILVIFSPSQVRAQSSRRSVSLISKPNKPLELSTLVPWDDMDANSGKIVQDVIKNKTIFRQMPMQMNYCDKELYCYLLDHPDVVAGMWEYLGATQLSLKAISPGKFALTETTGSSGIVEVVHKTNNLVVVYSQGSFVSPITPKPVNGETVLILHSRFGTDREGRPAVQSRIDYYVKIHNPGAEMLAKLISPIVGKIADANFEQAVGFVSSLSEASEADYEAIQNLASCLPGIDPNVIRDFNVVVENVYDHSVERFMIATGKMLPRTQVAATIPDEPEVYDEEIAGENFGADDEPYSYESAVSLPAYSSPVVAASNRPTQETPNQASNQASNQAPNQTPTASNSQAVLIPTISSNASQFVNSLSKVPATEPSHSTPEKESAAEKGTTPGTATIPVPVISQTPEPAFSVAK